MIVDQLNAVLGGGAAIAARRLHRGLLAAGVDSRFWHRDSTGAADDDPTYRRIRWPEAGSLLRRVRAYLTGRVRHRLWKQRLRWSLFGRPAGFDWFTAARLGRRTVFDLAQSGSDILHLHWVTRMIDYPSFFAAIPDDFPIVWTLHDMNPLTGGCHYASGCEAFTTECQHCPQLGRRGERDLANRFFHAKLAALRGKNLHIVAVSRWLEQQARQSRLLADVRSFRTIYGGLDVQAFRPQDKTAARLRLGLPADCTVIGFGADSIENHRKGFQEILTALTLLPQSPRVVGLVFGGGQIPAGNRRLPELKMLGFIDDPALQASVYSAADVFVIPSREEAFGLTGLEAMACGTPVVGFNTGGIPEYVRPGETGLLAEVGDAVDLARQISRLIVDCAGRLRMGENARAMVEREFRVETQAERYIDLYRSLLAAHQVKSVTAA